MGYSESLSVETRRRVYGLALAIYDSFEALPERGILIQDIESTINRVLKLSAVYPLREEKEIAITDIQAELKGLCALLGVVRDTSLLERQPALDLIQSAMAVEKIFSVIRESARWASQGKSVTPNLSGVEDRPSTIMKVEKDISGERIDKEKVSIVAIHRNMPDKMPSDGILRALSAREEAIVEVLKRRPKISVGDLDILFSHKVSKKTLQRDLQDLIDRRIVLREGDKRWAVYSLDIRQV